MSRKKKKLPEELGPPIPLADQPRTSLEDIERAINDQIPVDIAPDGTVTIGDGVTLQAAAHPGEISEAAIEETEIEVKNERFDAAVEKAVAARVAAARAVAWLTGRNAAMILALAETDTNHAAENGQAWVNCANHIAMKIAKLEVPG